MFLPACLLFRNGYISNWLDQYPDLCITCDWTSRIQEKSPHLFGFQNDPSGTKSVCTHWRAGEWIEFPYVWSVLQKKQCVVVNTVLSHDMSVTYKTLQTLIPLVPCLDVVELGFFAPSREMKISVWEIWSSGYTSTTGSPLSSLLWVTRKKTHQKKMAHEILGVRSALLTPTIPFFLSWSSFTSHTMD